MGYYSILAGKIVGKKGKVIALEPVPSTAEVLNLNVKLNDLQNINVIPKAAWSHKSIITIYMPENYYGWASPVKWQECKCFIVKAIQLDTICKGVSSIKLLKIDAEGSEYPILQGAQETLKITKNIILELSKDTNEILQILREASFKIHKMKFATYIHAEKV